MEKKSALQSAKSTKSIAKSTKSVATKTSDTEIKTTKKAPPGDQVISSKSSSSGNERETWGNHLDFIMSCLGFAVGLGNVWRYPYLAYSNGGAAFIIPYVISVILIGLPLYCLEVFVGQLSGLGASEAYASIAPLFYGVGWSMVAVSYLICLYYNMIIVYAMIYFVVSFFKILPYSTCGNGWNTEECLSRLDNIEHNCSSSHYYNFTTQVACMKTVPS